MAYTDEDGAFVVQAEATSTEWLASHDAVEVHP
jgi:hypothetical protein